MKTESKTIPKKWDTERLILSDTVGSDMKGLQAVYEDHFKETWVRKGLKMEPDYMKKYIAKPELPPKGKKEDQRLQTIRLKKDKSIIGYLDVYHGYPKKDIFWIGDLFLIANAQGKKYGQEAIEGLIGEVNKLKTYHYMRCNVALKNWSGIRFWNKMGFSKIVGYLGDKQYSADNFADIALEMSL